MNDQLSDKESEKKRRFSVIKPIKNEKKKQRNIFQQPQPNQGLQDSFRQRKKYSFVGYDKIEPLLSKTFTKGGIINPKQRQQQHTNISTGSQGNDLLQSLRTSKMKNYNRQKRILQHLSLNQRFARTKDPRRLQKHNKYKQKWNGWKLQMKKNGIQSNISKTDKKLYVDMRWDKEETQDFYRNQLWKMSLRNNDKRLFKFLPDHIDRGQIRKQLFSYQGIKKLMKNLPEPYYPSRFIQQENSEFQISGESKIKKQLQLGIDCDLRKQQLGQQTLKSQWDRKSYFPQV